MFSRRDQNLTFTQLQQRGQLEITETKTSDSFITSFTSYPKVRRQSVCDESKSSLGCTFRAMVTSTKLIRLHTHHFRQPVWGIPILRFSNCNNDPVEIIIILETKLQLAYQLNKLLFCINVNSFFRQSERESRLFVMIIKHSDLK